MYLFNLYSYSNKIYGWRCKFNFKIGVFLGQKINLIFEFVSIFNSCFKLLLMLYKQGIKSCLKVSNFKMLRGSKKVWMNMFILLCNLNLGLIS